VAFVVAYAGGTGYYDLLWGATTAFRPDGRWQRCSAAAGPTGAGRDGSRSAVPPRSSAGNLGRRSFPPPRAQGPRLVARSSLILLMPPDRSHWWLSGVGDADHRLARSLGAGFLSSATTALWIAGLARVARLGAGAGGSYRARPFRLHAPVGRRCVPWAEAILWSAPRSARGARGMRPERPRVGVDLRRISTVASSPRC